MRNFISEDDIEQAILQKLEGDLSNTIFCAVTPRRINVRRSRTAQGITARRNA